MEAPEIIIIRRDVDAYLIPSAAKISLPRGTEIRLTQSLGGSYTVNVYGNLARIDGKDVDALGKTVEVTSDVLENGSLEDRVLAQLKTCYDPEIPVNIVDLGLVYQHDIIPVGNKYHVYITMTLTAPGCGMGPVLAQDIKRKLLMLSKVQEVDVEIVLDPPWDRSMMSDEAKLILGLL